MALLFPIPKIMELGPPLALFISFLDIYCPMAIKITIGSTQDKIALTTGDVCWMICPENSAPDLYSRFVRSGSSTMPVL